MRGFCFSIAHHKDSKTDDELPEGEREQVRKHLALCPVCWEAQEDFLSLRQEIRSLGLGRKHFAREQALGRKRPFWPRFALPAAAALFLLILAAVLWRTLPTAQDTRPPVVSGTRVVDQTARHFEKAELLLRSFRNLEPLAEGSASSLADEKERSRQLFYQNMLLRQGAESDGNVPAKEMLNRLEPLLLDIANLPERPSPEDVLPIRERIQKKEIVALLSIYSPTQRN